MSRRGMPRACVCALAFSLTGCAGAPTFNFAGAYFPAWMLCAFVGIGAGIVARLLFVKHAMTTLFPYQLMVCVSISVIVAVVTWLVFFGL